MGGFRKAPAGGSVQGGSGVELDPHPTPGAANAPFVAPWFGNWLVFLERVLLDANQTMDDDLEACFNLGFPVAGGSMTGGLPVESKMGVKSWN